MIIACFQEQLCVPALCGNVAGWDNMMAKTTGRLRSLGHLLG